MAALALPAPRFAALHWTAAQRFDYHTLMNVVSLRMNLMASAALLIAAMPEAARAQATADIPPPPPGPLVIIPALSPSEQVAARMDPSDNLVEFADPQALGRFVRRWNTQDGKPLTIAHFGDSHVQLGWLVAPLRARFQQLRGNGGRGMIFPYAMAKTYSQEDYTSSFTGIWRTANSIQQPPRLPLGVSGFVGVTNDPLSSFTIAFTKQQSTDPQDVRLYVRAVNGTYRVELASGMTLTSTSVTADPATPVQVVHFSVPRLGSELTVTITRTDPPVVPPPADSLNGGPVAAADSPVSSFELYGLDLRSATGGLVYHNLGVGGANYNAVLQQRYFAQQYPLLGADLVILDYGTNDIIYKNAVPADHADKVRQTIRRIRALDPDVTILLTSVQDMNYRGRNVSAAASYAQVMREVAFTEHCLFFDWYRVSGGEGTMRLWSQAGLSSRDNIHLNGRGYRKRGEMLAEALSDTLGRLTRQPNMASLVRPPVITAPVQPSQPSVVAKSAE